MHVPLKQVFFEGYCEYQQLPTDQAATAYAVLRLIAPTAANGDDGGRSAIDLVCVVDRSGSMAEDNAMVLTQEALNHVIGMMSPQDRLCIVSFDNLVQVDLSLVEMDTEGKQKARNQVDLLFPRNSTDLCAGLEAGLQELANRQRRNPVSSLLLFTDGKINAGVKESEAILKRLKERIQCHELDDLIVHTFGLGSTYTPELLVALSDATRGIYTHLEKAENIPPAFTLCLGDLLSMAVTDVRLVLTSGGRVTIDKTYFPVNENNDQGYFLSTTIDNLRYGETRDLLFQLRIEPSALNNQCLVNAVLNYVDPQAQESYCLTTAIHVQRGKEVVLAGDEVLATFGLRKNSICAIQALEKVIECGRQQKWNEAQQHIDSAIKTLRRSATANEEAVTGMIAALTTVANKLDRDTFATKGERLALSIISHWRHGNMSCPEGVDVVTQWRSKRINQTK